MKQRTQTPERAAGTYRPCDKCVMGWDSAARRPCPCWAAWLNTTVPTLLAKHQAGPR